jgi:hypothetical protein
MEVKKAAFMAYRAAKDADEKRAKVIVHPHGRDPGAA